MLPTHKESSEQTLDSAKGLEKELWTVERHSERVATRKAL